MPPAIASALPLSCACGQLRGTFVAEPSRGARGVCYCDDCQTYGRWLDRDDVLNAWGGTEVIQTWPARVRLEEGNTQLRLARLTAKGLHRWYAGCCRTPVANSFGTPGLAFNGLMRRFIAAPDAELDGLYGPAHGVQGRFAPGGVPPGAHASASLGVILRAMGILLSGTLLGANRPSPWFDAAGRPVVEAQILG